MNIYMWFIMFIDFLILAFTFWILLLRKSKIKQNNLKRQLEKESLNKNDVLEDFNIREEDCMIIDEIKCVNQYVDLIRNNDELKDLIKKYYFQKTHFSPWILCFSYPPLSFSLNKNQNYKTQISFDFPLPEDTKETPYMLALKELKCIEIEKGTNDLYSDFFTGITIKKIILCSIKKEKFVPQNETEQTILTSYSKDIKSLLELSSALSYHDALKELVSYDNNLSNLTISLLFMLSRVSNLYWFMYFNKTIERLQLDTNGKTTFEDAKPIIINTINKLVEDKPDYITDPYFVYDVQVVIFFMFYKYNKNLIWAKFALLYQELIKQTVEEIKIEHGTKEYLAKLKSSNLKQTKTYSIAEIDQMSPSQFENFVVEMFMYLGYQAEGTKLSGDQGVDVIAKKNDKIVAIQAKHYNQPVGNHAIMEVVAGAKFYKATLCYVVTNNFFTKSAKELANANNVILIDRDKLIEKLSELSFSA